MQWTKKDNSMEDAKIKLRGKYLPENASVLDLFCGTGKMYKGAYQGKVKEYHGIDHKKVHNKDICTLGDNIKFIQRKDIAKYNVFDLDDYGCPWKLLYLILRKATQERIIFFITDGLVLKQKMGGNVVNFVSATERIPKGMKLPGHNRFYEDIFATMLLDIKKRYGYKIAKAVYFHNKRRTVYYWMLEMQKAGSPEFTTKQEGHKL